jgi:putative heme iron utilization protein
MSQKADIQALLKQTRIAFLATQGAHGSESSMTPFALHQGNMLLHISSLAKHTDNIQNYPNIGLMICTPDDVQASPLALPRLSLQGEAYPVPDERYDEAKQAYVKAVPEAETLFSFADFQLFECVPNYIHWVGGFGKARKIPLETWKSLC